MTITNESDIYYDPFNIEIDKDPHPFWKRMRDEAPLYRNEKFDFYALSRYDDVEKALVDWDTYRSGKGSTLEMIMAGFEIPPGPDPDGGPADPRPAPRPAVTRVHAEGDERDRAEGPRVLRPHPRPARRRRRLRLHRRPRRGHADAHDRHAARHPRGGPGGDPRPASTQGLRLDDDDEVPAGDLAWSRCRAVRRLHRLAGRAPVRRPHDPAPQRRVRGRDGHDAQARRARRSSPTSCCSPAPATRPRPG